MPVRRPFAFDMEPIMTEKDKPSVLRETDDEARRLARILLRSARSCALAVVEPDPQAWVDPNEL